MLKHFPTSRSGVDPNWSPNPDFDKAIGTSSKSHYAGRMQDRRAEQQSNFSAEVKNRQQALLSLPYKYQADFENACDCLYYGEGYNTWFKNAESHMSAEDAKNLWKIAVQFMSQDAENDWKRWINKRFIGGDPLNSLNKGIDFDDF